MALRLALVLIVLLASGCGGGGASAPAGSPAASTPLIRFAAVYEDDPAIGAGAKLTIRPIDGSTSIGSNPVARVEISTNNEPPQVLTAPNGSGGNEYVFALPDYDPNTGVVRNCREYPFKVTVTDSTGFALTKFDEFCPIWRSWSTGAFSDRGDRSVTLRVQSAQATKVAFRRYGVGYGDSYALRAVGFEQPLQAQAGDTVRLNAVIDPSAPVGSTATARIDGDDGSLAEGHLVAGEGAGSASSVFLLCCRTPQAAGATTTMILGVELSYDAPEHPIWEVHYQVVDGSGAVLRSEDMTGSGQREWPVEIASGQWIQMQAASLTPQVAVVASAGMRPAATTTPLASATGNSVKLRIY
jgi:hypothetical protein